MKYTDLIRSLASIKNDDLPITVYFDNGFIFKSYKNTGVFESTNGLDENDTDFLEYYTFFAEITEIIALPHNQSSEAEPLKTNGFFELSEVNKPLKVKLNNGRVLWGN